MSKHVIDTSVLYRFMQIPTLFEPTTTEDLKKELKTIRLEIKNKKQFIVSTNQQIAAVEYLGKTNEADDVCYLNLSEKLTNYINANYFLNEDFVVETIPDLAFAMAKTEKYIDNNPCLWFEENVLNNWRDWFSVTVEKQHGAMYWDLYHLVKLFESSPSGKINFPMIIDVNKPVLLRDQNNPNWLGVFIPSPNPDEKIYEPARLPEWF